MRFPIRAETWRTVELLLLPESTIGTFGVRWVLICQMARSGEIGQVTDTQLEAQTGLSNASVVSENGIAGRQRLLMYMIALGTD